MCTPAISNCAWRIHSTANTGFQKSTYIERWARIQWSAWEANELARPLSTEEWTLITRQIGEDGFDSLHFLSTIHDDQGNGSDVWVWGLYTSTSMGAHDDVYTSTSNCILSSPRQPAIMSHWIWYWSSNADVLEITERYQMMRQVLTIKQNLNPVH